MTEPLSPADRDVNLAIAGMNQRGMAPPKIVKCLGDGVSMESMIRIVVAYQSGEFREDASC